jgi:hypothetical protein
VFEKELSNFYKNYYPTIKSRVITPFSADIDPNKIEKIPKDLLYNHKFIDLPSNNPQVAVVPSSPSIDKITKSINKTDKTMTNESDESFSSKDSSDYLNDSNNNIENVKKSDQKWEKIEQKVI